MRIIFLQNKVTKTYFFKIYEREINEKTVMLFPLEMAKVVKLFLSIVKHIMFRNNVTFANIINIIIT